MVDRFLVCLSAGAVTAGVSMAMLAGAGFALADDGQASGAGSGSSSESSNSTGRKSDSDKDKTGKPESNGPSAGTGGDDTDGASGSPAEDQDTTGRRPSEAASTDGDTPPVNDTTEAKTAKTRSHHDAPSPAVHETAAGLDNDRLRPGFARSSTATAAKPEVKKETETDAKEAVEAKDADAPAQPEESTAHAADAAAPVDEAVAAAKTKQASATTALAFAAAEPAATPSGPTLINAIGTLFFGLFDMFTNVIEGPPVVPPNSNVRVGRSTLQIDCGDGYTAQADWYVPTGPEPPQGLIYLQHGILARASYYNVTAATLAESTNSIVIAPTITSNFFACDSCHLTGDPMHFAIAKLFSGDRAALKASLDAAFESEDIDLPQKYVLVGHSGGSQLAAGVAGFASQLGGPDGSPDLAGVILFDTNDIGKGLSRGIAKVPLTTPVYYLGGDPALLNNFDELNGVMQQLRPNQFTGFRLIGGVHTDSLKGTNPLVQFISDLALGFPKPANAAAVQLLASGWINDMFSTGADTGVYALPGASVDIETEAGIAQAVALGGPLHQLNFFESIFSFFFGLANNLRFGYCAADVDALLAGELATSTDGFAFSVTSSPNGRRLCHRGGEQA